MSGVDADDTRPTLDLLSDAFDVVEFAGEPDAQELIASAMRSLKKENRWKAFTDDELAAISEIIGTHIDARFWAMITEVEAEIERRKA